MIEKYAPPHENDTAGYLRHLRRQTGVKDEKKIRDFSEVEFGKLVDAILAMEGRKNDLILTAAASGKKEIVRVRKDKKGTITHYEVAGLGWLRKTEAIGFARAGEIDAVVATSKSGRPFLKTRPDVTVVNNLDNKN